MPHSGIVALTKPWTAGPGGNDARSTAGPSFRCRRQPVRRTATDRRGHRAEQRTTMSQMKWWGWGDEGVAFTHEDKPELGPFLLRHLDLDVGRPTAASARFEDLQIPAPTLNGLELPDASTDPLDRVTHARGKSLRDLVHHRRGELGRLPDAVV